LKPEQRRNQLIELLRIASCYGIVWFHSGLEAGHTVSYSGLSIFLFLTGYFSTRNFTGQPASLMKISTRLIYPWVFWSAVYMAINLLRFKTLFHATDPTIFAFLAGPSIHLWYVPYIILCQLLLGFIGKSMKPALFPYFIAVAMFAAFALLVHFDGAYTPPIPQYLNATPPLLAGALFGMRRETPFATAALLVFVGLCAVAYGAFHIIPALPYLIAVILCASAIIAGKNIDLNSPAIASFSRCTFGVYFIHPIFLALNRAAFAQTNAVSITLAFALSALTACLLMRFLPPGASAVVLGETRAIRAPQKVQTA
jgi:surface polysaccharide O-acyltransferase-like enzyme